MSDTLHAVVLGIIEGLTEFIPVSSTGHLIIAERALGLDSGAQPWKTLLWVSQCGAILAVVVCFWKDLWTRTFRPPSRDWRRHIFAQLFFAMVPTVLLGLYLKPRLDWLENDEVSVAAALIVFAIVLEIVDRLRRRRTLEETRLEEITPWQAFAIGLLQCLSMWPGVSRAGASIVGGMAVGLSPRTATLFSFYLAIPTLLGAGAKTLWKSRHDLTPDLAGIVAVGTAVAFLVALPVVRWLIDFVRKHRFTPFALYRVLLGVAVLAWHFLK